MTEKYILRMNNITKEFPGVRALENVSLKVCKGEIHGLVGENGAGKSTLMKVLSSVYPLGTYSGEIFIDEKSCQFSSVEDAKKAGVTIIYQELVLAKNLNIAENIFLGEEPNHRGIINWNKVYSDAAYWLSEVGLNINPGVKAGDLVIGQQQLLEIAKALSKKTRILILDEPTAALSKSEIDKLMSILNRLKETGVTCIFISHKIKEVFKISDTITILRDGKNTCTKPTSKLTEPEVISLMVGREIKDLFPKEDHKKGNVVFEVQNMSLIPIGKNEPVVENVSFNVCKGEILGIAGLMGAGRTELLCGIFGEFQGKTTGKIFIKGKKVNIKNPADAIQCGLALVPEDRRKDGIVSTLSVLKNISLASLKIISNYGFINSSKEYKQGFQLKDSLRIKTPSLETIISTLSGGNQQKVILAKWLALGELLVLFLDEPTRGIDVVAKYEIHTIINDLAKKGIAIIMASSELPEILGISDRVLVMHEGTINGEFLISEATEEKIMYAATGGH